LEIEDGNRCLLRSRHHHDIHRGRFHVERHAEGHLVFTRPDKSVVDLPRFDARTQ
jgi:hypothetical protein